MSQYIDGFAFPIALENLEDYQPIAAAVGEIYKEHGALGYFEFVGDDMNREGTRPFPDVFASTKDETIVFGWALFKSREHRDLVNKRVETDPRMAELVDPLMSGPVIAFDPSRMAYGGFRPLVSPDEPSDS